jgi:hypothetical protein
MTSTEFLRIDSNLITRDHLFAEKFMIPNVLTRRRAGSAVIAGALLFALAACEQKASPGVALMRADARQTPASNSTREPGVPDTTAVSTLVAQARVASDPAAQPSATPVEQPERKPATPRAPAGAGKPSAGRPASDAELAARVKTAVLAQPVSALMFNVNVSKGVVTLSGTADSNETRDKAGRAAADVAGVKSVNNRITVLAGS